MVKLDEYTHDFEGKKREEVFDRIIQWLDIEKAEIENSNRPSQITAIHGSRKTVSVWKRDARKKLIFTLDDLPGGTHINIETHTGSLMYADDVNSWRQQIYINYGLLLEEIWDSVNGVSHINPIEQEESAQKNGTEKKSKWKLFK
jgi:hypothetical protein